jgi:hypothetical protein
MICKDGIVECWDGSVGLQATTEIGRERHMEKIWMRALNKKLQHTASSSEKK